MTRITRLMIAATFVLQACGTPEEVQISETAPKVTFTPEHDAKSFVGKPQGPVRIAYRVVGEPVVGQPVTLDLSLRSNIGEASVQLDVRMPDTTAVLMAADQLQKVALSAPSDDRPFGHQLTVIPQREGRLFVNVSASVETPDGTLSTVTAIPLQVGEGPRVLQDNGTVVETKDGELLRTLPGK